jgi:hypothetical protein
MRLSAVMALFTLVSAGCDSGQARLSNVTVAADTDAFLTYVARPFAFDAARQVPLDGFLYGIAARILRDRLRSDGRRSLREGNYAERIGMTRGDRADERGVSRVALGEVRQAHPSLRERSRGLGAKSFAMNGMSGAPGGSNPNPQIKRTHGPHPLMSRAYFCLGIPARGALFRPPVSA